jgi:hypothetical protein
MSPLFGDKDEMAAKRAAASAEIERLTALPARDLAAEILPLFASSGPPAGPLRAREGSDSIARNVALRVAAPLGRGSVSSQTLGQLRTPIKEAIQALVNAGLLLQEFHSDGGLDVFITRLGQAALRDGDVVSYLNGPAR